MKQSLFTLGAAFALAGVSQAIYVIDDFELYAKDNTTSMNGIGGPPFGTWSVTNGTSGLDEIAVTTNYTFDLSDGAALIGGFDPDFNAPTFLSHGASTAMFGGTNGMSAFTIDFGFLDSLNANRDDYSISLTSTAGNLLTIDLTPAANPNTFNISFSSDFFTGVTNWGTLDALDTLGNPYFSIQFLTGTDGIGGMFYALKDLNSNTLMSDGSLTGTALTDTIDQLDISVNTAGAAGDGFLVIDNVKLVPEPSSALLGLLGAAFAFTRRRRA